MKKRITMGTMLMITLMAVVVTFNITFYVAESYFGARLGESVADVGDFKKLTEVAAIIDKYYIGDYEQENLLDGAMAGYVDGLGDEWSSYFTREQYVAVNEAKENKYVGVGITITTDETNKSFIIKTVTENSPAAKAGIVPFDKILEVEGIAADSINQNELVKLVKGNVGETVKMKVQKKATDEIVDLILMREEIYTPDISSKIVNGNIGYMAIGAFNSGVDKEFERHLQKLLDEGAKAFVFDVRFNGGGYAEVMSSMLDKLLPEGTIISMTSKDGKTTDSKSDAACLNMPMSVITNKYSISAAEFFAASIQEYGVGTVVGDHTGGKGYAQTMLPLSDGSAINLSTSRYYTPKGNSLAGKGIAPDVSVSLTEDQMKNFASLTEADDAQLQKAIEILIPKIK